MSRPDTSRLPHAALGVLVMQGPREGATLVVASSRGLLAVLADASFGIPDVGHGALLAGMAMEP